MVWFGISLRPRRVVTILLVIFILGYAVGHGNRSYVDGSPAYHPGSQIVRPNAFYPLGGYRQ